MSLRRWLAWVAVVLLASILLPVAAAAAALRLAYAGTPDPSARSHGRDALWMGHAWVDGRRGQSDLDDLARRLRGSGIRDVYVHIGPLDERGALDRDLYPRAEWFLDGFRDAFPGVRVSAWLGNIVGPGGLDLADSATRRTVVASAAQALRAGFDGVHYDLEPLPDGNVHFLQLLERTRTVTAEQGAPLSVAAEQLEPMPYLSDLAGLVHPQFWSVGYLREVALRVDQVALMAYDTAIPVESLYGGYVARQTRLALDAVPPEVDLLIGVPAFHTDDLGHHEAAETVAAGLRGVRLAYSDRPRARFGVALYVDFAATPEDWRAYRQAWVRRVAART